MKINRAYKFRLYPSKQQIKYIDGCFNACRFVYNVSLDCEEQLYVLGAKSNLTPIALKYHLKYYKISNPWLKDYDSKAYEYEMDNLANAYKKFFKRESGFPKYKKKYDRKQSFTTGGSIRLIGNTIKIPKVKKSIKAKIHREVIGKIKTMTISRENNKYYVSIMVEDNITIIEKKIKKEVGIDLGVKDFLITDKGKKIDIPKFLKSEAEHMKKLQQKLSRCKKGSKNRENVKKQISNLHEKIKNKRLDFLHNTSNDLVNEYDIIYMENLNVSGMTKSSKGTIEIPGKMVKQKAGLNKAILDVSLGEFKRQLSYKSKFRGKKIQEIGTFFPSSKLCSGCGFKNKYLKLSDRNWVCENCGAELDRDVNAAKNIKKEGKRLYNEKK